MASGYRSDASLRLSHWNSRYPVSFPTSSPSGCFLMRSRWRRDCGPSRNGPRGTRNPDAGPWHSHGRVPLLYQLNSGTAGLAARDQLGGHRVPLRWHGGTSMTRPTETITAIVGNVVGATLIILNWLGVEVPSEVAGAIVLLLSNMVWGITAIVASRQRAGSLPSAADGSVRTTINFPPMP